MNSKKYRFVPDLSGHLSDDDAKAYISRFGFAVFGLGMASTLSANIIYMLIAPTVTAIDNLVLSTVVNYLLSFVALYVFGMPVFCAIAKVLPTIRPIKSKMPAADIFGGLCLSLTGMLVGNYISNIILIWLEAFFGIVTENPIASSIDPKDPIMVVLTVVFTVILAPILEELLFRKILCGKLLALGEGYAIVLSAAAFGLIHGNLYQFAYGFLLGMLFAFIYVKTGKLRYSIFFHMVINFLGAVVGPYIMSLMDTEAINSLLETSMSGGTVDMTDPVLIPLFIMGVYEMVLIALGVVGAIKLSRAKKSGLLTLEVGILPPQKKGRVGRVLCTVGVAASITYFTVMMLLSLLPTK